MENREYILKGLEPLFKRAKEENLWFHCNYQDLWFSPMELREEHKNGKFIWGFENWQLLDPKSQIKSMVRRIVNTKKEIEQFKKRITDNLKHK